MITIAPSSEVRANASPPTTPTTPIAAGTHGVAADVSRPGSVPMGGHYWQTDQRRGELVARVGPKRTCVHTSTQAIHGVHRRRLFIRRRCEPHGILHVVNITTTLVDYADSAIEYALRGIRVNAASPGVIQTSTHDPEDYVALGARQPIGRVGQVDDIVAGVLFLESSTFITGETIHIDGGRIAGH